MNVSWRIEVQETSIELNLQQCEQETNQLYIPMD